MRLTVQLFNPIVFLVSYKYWCPFGVKMTPVFLLLRSSQMQTFQIG